MHRTVLYANFTPVEHANFLAAKTVAYATAFLDGRDNAATALIHARTMFCELLAAPNEPAARTLLDPSQMLLVAMMSAAADAAGSAGQDRWMQVMGALVELVRQKCKDLRPGAVHVATAGGG